MAIDMRKFLLRFVTEAREHIKLIGRGVTVLEENPDDQEMLANIFRAAHTIKGSSRMLKLIAISQTAHAMESVFGAMRDGTFSLTSEASDLLFQGIDAISVLIDSAEEEGEMVADETLLNSLEQVVSSPPPEKSAPIVKDPPIEKTPAVEIKTAVEKIESIKKKTTTKTNKADKTAIKKDKSVKKDKSTEKDPSVEKVPKVEEKSPEKKSSTKKKKSIQKKASKKNQSSKNRPPLNEKSAVVEKTPTIEKTDLDHRLGQTTVNPSERGRTARNTGGTTALQLPSPNDDQGQKNPVADKPPTIEKNPVTNKPQVATQSIAKTPSIPSPIANKPSVTKKPTPVKKPPIPKKPQKKGSKPAETIRMDAANLDELIKISGGLVTFRGRLGGRLGEITDFTTLARDTQRHITEYQRFQTATNTTNLSNEETQLTLAQNTARLLSERLDRFQSLLSEDMDVLELLFMELQDKALKLRMLPLSSLFDTLPRMVRDIARTLGKKVHLKISGGETELDRNIIDRIGDPLMHMLRNAVDHGLESPEKRVELNKPETGTVSLIAHTEGSSVVLELEDDGAGIPVAFLKEKAIKNNIMDKDELERKSPSELVRLIFHPGLSTSKIITDISGRGVGMDVVYMNIVGELNGAVDVSSKLGVGSKFSIRLPLTMATLRVLMFRVGMRTFAFSSGAVQEICKVLSQDLIQVVGRLALRLREQIIPVIHLDELLGIRGLGKEERSEVVLIIVSNGAETMGLIVRDVLEEEVMVLKPMPHLLQENRMVSGSLLSGENEVVLVLDAAHIIQCAKKILSTKKMAELSKKQNVTLLERKKILVVDDSLNTRELEKDILESQHYLVSLAQDGREGLEMAKQNTFDLIVTDVEMPHMDGFTLTEKLRETDAYRNTPIVIVSSREKQADKQRGIQVGANAYIIKGAFDEFSLLETVQKLLEINPNFG